MERSRWEVGIQYQVLKYVQVREEYTVGIKGQAWADYGELKKD
jgi:hypothetical protein